LALRPEYRRKKREKRVNSLTESERYKEPS
jgi:hypothetical protein